MFAGRGAPEIDVLEYGKLGADGGLPTYVHTMQMGPVLPPYTSWYSADGTSGEGIRMPGKGTAFETHLPNYRGALTRDGYPRTGEQGSAAAMVACIQARPLSAAPARLDAWCCWKEYCRAPALQKTPGLATLPSPCILGSDACACRQHCDRHLHWQQLPQG